jgi:hypothetical protein
MGSENEVWVRLGVLGTRMRRIEDVIERAYDHKDRMKYAGLGLGRVGARGGGNVYYHGRYCMYW